jgi:hypothetical protein
MALVNTDGAVTPMGSAQKTTTRYYHGDHLGSSRPMTAYEGFPIWEATYLPFRQEHFRLSRGISW